MPLYGLNIAIFDTIRYIVPSLIKSSYKFLPKMYLWTRKNWLNFGSDLHLIWTLDSSTLQDRALFHNLAHISDLHEDFITHIFGQRSPHQILEVIRFGLQIRTLDLDRICLGSPSSLVLWLWLSFDLFHNFLHQHISYLELDYYCKWTKFIHTFMHDEDRNQLM